MRYSMPSSPLTCAPCFTIKVEIDVMLRTGLGGAIINNASVSGVRNPNPGLALYSASKAAVLSLTRSAALEYAPRAIRINAVSPGRVETPMMMNSGIADMSAVAQGLPVRRMGKPEEVARAVLWLASDAASFVVGHECPDGVTALAEETKDALKSVPVILITSLGIFGLCIVAGCLLEAPLVRDHAIDLDSGVSPLAIIARQGYWPALGTLGDALITLASTAATIAFANYGARVVATAAIDGLLPLWISAIHPHFRSPHRAVVVQGCLCTLLCVMVGAVFRTSPMELTTYLSNMMVFMWLVPYIVVCVGIVAIARREKSLFPGFVCCGLLGAISCLGLLIYSLSLQHSDPNWRLAMLSYSLVGVCGIFCWRVRVGRDQFAK
jgi:Enoyl-(Acyl carrier protein) reductase/Amino acid permease